MRNIYRKIAKEHGVTVAEVKREMQAAIDYVRIIWIELKKIS